MMIIMFVPDKRFYCLLAMGWDISGKKIGKSADHNYRGRRENLGLLDRVVS